MSTLDELIRRPEWMADANCRGLDPEMFFPGRGATIDNLREICRRCDVQAECLTYAINNGEKNGFWGGKSERQRRVIRRKAFGRDTPPLHQSNTAPPAAITNTAVAAPHRATNAATHMPPTSTNNDNVELSA